MFEIIKNKINEIKRQKEEEIVHEKVSNYFSQIRRTINYDLKMSKQFDDNIWLWDTNRFVDQFAQEIKDHHLKMHMVEGGLVEYIMFVKWLSVRLKMINDETITKLIQEYVKYGIKHYDVKIFGREITKYYNSPVYPIMIFDTYCREKYGRFNWFDVHDEKAEFLDIYNPYYSPLFDADIPGVPEIKIIDNGSDIIFEPMKIPADDASPEEIENWFDEIDKEFRSELSKEELNELDEILRRFENDASNR